MSSPVREAVRQAGGEQQLPDFDIIASCHQSLATELVKCRNIPALDLGAQVLNEIRGMREDMQRMREDMQTMREGFQENMQRMREDNRENMQRIDCRFKAMEVNNVARLINSSLGDPDGQLSPLHDVATNEPVDRFPATPRAIKDMNSATLNTVLRALGMETSGVLESRKQRLRVQIGLKAEPV